MTKALPETMVLRGSLEKQAKAYRLQGETKFQGLDIAIENRKGSKRYWYDPHGKEQGSTHMHFDYGYIRKTKGTDGDHVDVYLGPNEASDRVFIINQMKKPGFDKFDEQKVMLGFDSAEEAKKAYLKQYDDPRFFGSMKEMTFSEFKTKVLVKENHGKKIATLLHVGGAVFGGAAADSSIGIEKESALSPSMLRHGAIGAGLGALAGGVGGAAHAQDGHRTQGLLRGALVGAGLGAAGGAGVASIKSHGAQQLATLRGAATEAEQFAGKAHQHVRELGESTFHSKPVMPGGKQVSTSAVNPTASTVAVSPSSTSRGTVPGRMGANVGPKAAPKSELIDEFARANMTPERFGYKATENVHPMARRGVDGQLYRPNTEMLQKVDEQISARVAPRATPAAAAPAGGTPQLSGRLDVAQDQARAAGARATALGSAANTLEQQHGVMNRAIDRAALVGGAAGTGLMGYMAVPREYGGVGTTPGASPKVASDNPRVNQIADRVDDLGIGILASPYVNDIANTGFKKMMLRGGRMGQVGAWGHAATEGLGHVLHHPVTELAGLALVAPGVVHPIAKGIDKMLPRSNAPIDAAKHAGRVLANEKVGGMGDMAFAVSKGLRHGALVGGVGGAAAGALHAGEGNRLSGAAKGALGGTLAGGAIGAGTIPAFANVAGRALATAPGQRLLSRSGHTSVIGALGDAARHSPTVTGAVAGIGGGLAAQHMTKQSGVGRLALGLGAVGAVGAGLYGAKKTIDGAAHMASHTHRAASFPRVVPGMPPPAPAG